MQTSFVVITVKFITEYRHGCLLDSNIFKYFSTFFFFKGYLF